MEKSAQSPMSAGVLAFENKKDSLGRITSPDGCTGQLSVGVLSAHNLIALDIGGGSDPYCVIRVGKSTKQTSVSHNTLRPEWKEVLTFKVVLPTFDRSLTKEDYYVTIEVWDYDKLNQDDFMGAAMLPLAFLGETPTTCLLPLGRISGSQKVTGEILVTLSLKSTIGGWKRNDANEELYRACLQHNFHLDIFNGTDVIQMPGPTERVEMVLSDILVEISGWRAVANVYLTDYRLVIICEKEKQHLLDSATDLSMWVALNNITNVEKSEDDQVVRRSLSKTRPAAKQGTDNSPSSLVVHCADFRVIRLTFVTVSSFSASTGSESPSTAMWYTGSDRRTAPSEESLPGASDAPSRRFASGLAKSTTVGTSSSMGQSRVSSKECPAHRTVQKSKSEPMHTFTGGHGRSRSAATAVAAASMATATCMAPRHTAVADVASSAVSDGGGGDGGDDSDSLQPRAPSISGRLRGLRNRKNPGPSPKPKPRPSGFISYPTVEESDGTGATQGQLLIKHFNSGHSPMRTTDPPSVLNDMSQDVETRAASAVSDMPTTSSCRTDAEAALGAGTPSSPSSVSSAESSRLCSSSSSNTSVTSNGFVTCSESPPPSKQPARRASSLMYTTPGPRQSSQPPIPTQSIASTSHGSSSSSSSSSNGFITTPPKVTPRRNGSMFEKSASDVQDSALESLRCSIRRSPGPGVFTADASSTDGNSSLESSLLSSLPSADISFLSSSGGYQVNFNPKPLPGRVLGRQQQQQQGHAGGASISPGGAAQTVQVNTNDTAGQFIREYVDKSLHYLSKEQITGVLYSMLWKSGIAEHSSQHQPHRLVTTLLQRLEFIIQNAADCPPSKLFVRQSLQSTKLYGWNLLNMKTEMERQKVSGKWWCIANSDICETYPDSLYVPKSLPEEVIRSCAEFRSRDRLPVLCWYNAKKHTGILRCAQPLPGATGKFSVHDESVIKEARLTCPSEELVIFDARSRVAAGGNMLKGKGTEDTVNRYKLCKLLFLDIANIHAMRESIDKLHKVCCNPSNTHWLSQLESSQWLKHCSSVLRGAYTVARHVEDHGAMALIHCSDGWDRTSQLSSLAQLLLDPFYRTYHGFKILVEKEWLAFGHKFEHRLGHPLHSQERSPVFLQFLDCIWQVMQQFPAAFEFNEQYLLAIANHLNSGWFGTFLCNSNQERLSQDLRLTTVSMWAYLDALKLTATNPSYVETSELLRPQTSLRRLHLWFTYLLQYDDASLAAKSDICEGEDSISSKAHTNTSLVVWVPNDRAPLCHDCHQAFTALRRKHHCRACGQVFCSECTRQRIRLPRFGYYRPERVCDACFRIYGEDDTDTGFVVVGGHNH